MRLRIASARRRTRATDLRAREPSLASSAVRLLALVCAFASPGCLSDQIKENQRQLEQQQTQINQLQQEIAALQNARVSYNTAPPPGGCDQGVMGEATHKGAERFAANDLTRALAYYQDAADACPTSPRAQVNLAHLYEAMNDNAQALAHYQEAVRLSGPPADPDAVAEARAAVARLQK